MDFKLTEEKRYIILYTWLKVNIFLDPFTLSSVKVRGHLSKVRLDDRYFNVVIRSLIQFVELLRDSEMFVGHCPGGPCPLEKKTFI